MNKVSLSTILIIFLLVLTFNANAQTTSGTISKSETWKGEILLTGDVTISGGGKLTISPGTVVKAQPDTDDQQGGVDAKLIELIIDGGELDASGTDSEHIIFISEGKWYGIRHVRGILTLKYCEQNAGVIGLSVESSVPKAVEKCKFIGNTDKGASFKTSFKLVGCHFENNATIGLHFETGIRAEACEVNFNGTDGISGNGTAMFDNCNITFNGGAGVNVTGTATLNDCTVTFNGGIGVNVNSTATVNNCTITDNGDMGLNVSGSNPNTASVRDTTIARNVGAGVNVSGDGCTNTVTIANCTITENGGIGVKLHGSAIYRSTSSSNTLTVSDCTITQNGGEGVSMTGYTQSGGHGTWHSYKTATVSNCIITENVGAGVKLSQASWNVETVTINNCEIRGNSDAGIYSGYLFVASSSITDNTGTGVSLVGVKGFTKNCVSSNTIGVQIRSDASGKIEGITGNDIFGNVTNELENTSAAEIVADDNYWGSTTTTELQSKVANLTKIFDKQDNPNVGPVTISTYRTEPIGYCDGGGNGELPTLTASVEFSSGIHIISLPLNPLSSYTASSLAEELGSTIVIRAEDGAFDAYVHDNKIGTDFPIEMSRGYIVNLKMSKTFEVTGKPWVTSAAPPINTSSEPWAFVIAGRVEGEIPAGGQLRVTNLRTKESIIATISPVKHAASLFEKNERAARFTTGEFAAAFVDMSQRPVVSVGDEFIVQVIGADGTSKLHVLQAGTSRHGTSRLHVLQDDIARAYLLTYLSAKPEQTQLFQNYPNPFNPETWIPYQLTKPADVTIHIYNARGQLVRTLLLGQQGAGFYLNRSNAVYWNGRNELGERVASGVYFYQLKTRDFTATRRMVIVK